MKKLFSTMLFAWLSVMLAACAGGSAPKSNDSAEDLLAGELAGEITVSCYDAMLYEPFLNEAAALFEAKHPGTKINIEVFSKMPEIKTMETEDGSMVSVSQSGDDPQDVMNYISRINTQLMSGQGPDILAMDVLPYYKYAESGLLEDLRIYMEADGDFDIGEYRRNIMEGMKYQSGQYIMPLDFGFHFISFDKNRVDAATADKLRERSKFTYWELTDLIKEQFANDSSNARVIDFQGGAAQAFRNQFRMEHNHYVDLENKKANFNDGSFAELLERIHEQRQSGYFRPDFASMEEQTQDFIEAQRLYYLKFEIDMTLKNIFYPRDDFNQQEAFPIPDPDEIAGLLTNDAGEAVIRNFQAYGMNANSQNKKLAWQFIKFLLGEEMQQSLNLLGFPVNNAAFIEDSKLYMITMPNYVESGNDEYTVDGIVELAEQKYVDAYASYMEYLNEFVNELSLYPITDKIIDDMVASETALFFDGSRSAEEVANTLQNRVQLYLDE